MQNGRQGREENKRLAQELNAANQKIKALDSIEN